MCGLVLLAANKDDKMIILLWLNQKLAPYIVYWEKQANKVHAVYDIYDVERFWKMFGGD